MASPRPTPPPTPNASGEGAHQTRGAAPAHRGTPPGRRGPRMPAGVRPRVPGAGHACRGTPLGPRGPRLPAGATTQGRGERRAQPVTGRWSGFDSDCPFEPVATCSPSTVGRAVPRAPGGCPSPVGGAWARSRGAVVRPGAHPGARGTARSAGHRPVVRVRQQLPLRAGGDVRPGRRLVAPFLAPLGGCPGRHARPRAPGWLPGQACAASRPWVVARAGMRGLAPLGGCPGRHARPRAPGGLPGQACSAPRPWGVPRRACAASRVWGRTRAGTPTLAPGAYPATQGGR